MRTIGITLFASFSYAASIDRNYLDILNNTMADLKQYASTRRKFQRRERKTLQEEIFEASEIERVQSQAQCKAGFEFDQDSCTCQAQNRCSYRCPLGYLRNPFVECGCLNYEKFQEIYNHTLDENCEQSPTSKKANAVLSKNDQLGAYYR